MNLVILYPHTLWTQKMSPARRHSLEAVMRHPGVRTVVSGAGWPGYSQRKSVSDNVHRLMPDCQAVYWYKPLGMREAPALLAPERLHVPAVLRFNEAWWPGDAAAEEVRQSGSKLVVCHHANDLPRLAGCGAEVIHLPHCAEQRFFARAAKPDERRNVQALLAGNLSRDVYPLRHRLAQLIRKQSIPGGIRPHPGYRLRDEAEVIAQVSEYAWHLGRSRIALHCTSRYRYALAKLVEAAMAGCLLVGDLPDDPLFLEHFGDLIVPLEPTMSDAQIADTVRWWLSRHTERIERARATQAVALAHFTQEHYAARFVAAVERLIGA